MISAGGTVSFMINGRVHQVAIYEPGVGPDDIDDSGRTGFDDCPGGAEGERYIDDPDGLVAIWDPPCNDGPNPIMYTFEEPGRYFVVCTFDSHFEIGMWGWVIVL